MHGVELLVPVIGELAGGGLREYRPEVLEKCGLVDQKLAWYLDLRKWGMAPSGGFGIGFERLLIYMLGINNIRDSIPFPRCYENCLS